MLKNFKSLENDVKQEEKKTIAVVMAEDKDILAALDKARLLGLSESILTGNRKKILQNIEQAGLDSKAYEIIDTKGEGPAVDAAVSLVRNGQAQVLMKGLCPTAVFLRGVLDKERGLRAEKILSHLALFECPGYSKILMMSDAAMNIAPGLVEKVQILRNALQVARRLGYHRPKVAVLSALETVNAEGIPSSVDAAVIAKMGERGQIRDAIIDGPLAVDTALSKQACKVKKLKSAVGGDADICLVPNIETGNVFYKLLTLMGQAKVAGIVVGASAPVVLTSRADTDESKYFSILTALKASQR
jgi:phosphate butyryltransferase